MPPMQLTGAIVRAGKMNKTVTMAVARDVYLSKLQKTVTKHKKYLIHDEQNQLLVGDNVVAEACPPISARKRFRFVELVGGVEAGEARRLRSQQLMAAEERERVRIEGIVRAERQAATGRTGSNDSGSASNSRLGKGRTSGAAPKKGMLAQLGSRTGVPPAPKEVQQGNTTGSTASPIQAGPGSASQ
ncbi:hypothetical protein OC835_003482 [Tilletia horrida]|nr:hypothetical protein OC835_003482 [Tilletia horrida]